MQDKLAMLEGGIKTEKGEDIPIYDDLGDYKPRKEDLKREDDRRRGDHHRRDDYRSSRDDDRRRDRDRGDRRERYDRDRGEEEDRGRRTYFDRSSEQEVEEHRGGFSTQDKQMIKNLIKKQEEKDKAKVRRTNRCWMRDKIFLLTFVGSSVADPWHFGVDPDPAAFVIDHQVANKKLIKKSFSAYYFLKVHLHHLSKIKSKKEVTKQ